MGWSHHGLALRGGTGLRTLPENEMLPEGKSKAVSLLFRGTNWPDLFCDCKPTSPRLHIVAPSAKVSIKQLSRHV